MVRTRGTAAAEDAPDAPAYNLRRRTALMTRAPMQVALAQDNRTLKYVKGMKPEVFLKKLNEENPEMQIIDIKDLIRAPTKEEIKKALFEKAKVATGIKITLTGEKSQEYGMTILRACANNINFLEIVLPKHANGKFQKELMTFLLEVPVKTLLIFGSFNCVTDLGAPVNKESTVATLRCPGEARARNNFISKIIEINENTLVMLDFGEDPLPASIRLATGCSNLMVMKVNSFADLVHLESMPKVVQVLVQGCQESVDTAVNTILGYQSTSLLARVRFLGIFANPAEHYRMHHVLLAVGGMCQQLSALQLINWSGEANVEGALKTMPGVSLLILKNCTRLKVQILNDIMSKEALPHLRGLILDQTTWTLSSAEVAVILQRLTSERPNLKVDEL